VLSATEREIAVLRKVTSDRKLELADQYVIYSDGAAICRPTDRRRVLATFVEPSLPVGDGWHMGLPLGPIFYLLLKPREFRGVGVTSRPLRDIMEVFINVDESIQTRNRVDRNIILDRNCPLISMQISC
jgi:hypothetical protein